MNYDNKWTDLIMRSVPNYANWHADEEVRMGIRNATSGFIRATWPSYHNAAMFLYDQGMDIRMIFSIMEWDDRARERLTEFITPFNALLKQGTVDMFCSDIITKILCLRQFPGSVLYANYKEGTLMASLAAYEALAAGHPDAINLVP